MITITYWVILLPIVTIRKRDPNYDSQYDPKFGWFGLVNHGLPMCIIALEWWQNQILVNLLHLPLIVALATCYFAINTAM